MCCSMDKNILKGRTVNKGLKDSADLEIVYSYLHGMEALSNLREHQLRIMCETVRYERHEANEVLYYPDDIGTCWYILLSGSVFIKESMFLPRSSVVTYKLYFFHYSVMSSGGLFQPGRSFFPSGISLLGHEHYRVCVDMRLGFFGKRSAGSLRRGCECIVLEPSEMIVVDYMDENEEYFQRQASHRQSRRRFRKINQKGERQTIIDTVDPYPTGKPPIGRGYHTVSHIPRTLPVRLLL
ncbi:Rap guanine nucleotide exchange factor 6 PDZ domain-containing guanine nucleotide exchange factor 2 [Triplophysa tibetana]|uniref:Rap guanine nucleotide exchange factor 6 PDZ domain-containing guanine nucleotide exchange factor 2 n=1 Tax=Triplophysa tibetana TaxID=1572043 RepID=A0A5A9NJJ0_9TELE|nr:Rap guanine nucleotide exchange factor 6 PDZ domain-containing guanine nucleotide exchange factor 2 [Triplophysa tibetana]